MDVLVFSVNRELSVEDRWRLKDRLADAYREVTGTTDDIGVDRVPVARTNSRQAYSGPLPTVYTDDGRSVYFNGQWHTVSEA